MTEDLLKVVNLLKFRGCSDGTIDGYLNSINRFKKHYNGKDIQNFNEADIVDYLTINFINLGRKTPTVNRNRAAIKYYYSVNFGIEFDKILLPTCKIKPRYPKVLSNDDIMFLIDNEKKLKQKLWLCLAYGSGLRVSEIAYLKVGDFSYKQKKIKVIGKGNKERFTIFPDYTHDILLEYYYENKDKIIASGGYLFPLNMKNCNNKHISSRPIQDYFFEVRKKYNLDASITFHTLRHSFATEFIKNGGDILTLKTLMGHTSIKSTEKYIHMASNLDNLCSPIDKNI